MAGPVIHAYRASEPGLNVNSYLVEGESGVVVVDTNLLVSDIEALRARLEALKKPLLAVLVTHPRPDHFNGVAALVGAQDVPVYAAASVGRVIEEIAAAKREQWSPTYGAEWPAETYFPDSLRTDGDQIRLGELPSERRDAVTASATRCWLAEAGRPRRGDPVVRDPVPAVDLVPDPRAADLRAGPLAEQPRERASG